MHRPLDRKPSPEDRSSGTHETPRTSSQQVALTLPSSVLAAALDRNPSAHMLTHGLAPLNREESFPEVASMLPSPTSSFAARGSSVLTQLDEIWDKDLSKVNLPDYVKTNSTTITFPEKVGRTLPIVSPMVHLTSIKLIDPFLPLHS